jgi:hypothetical protein
MELATLPTFSIAVNDQSENPYAASKHRGKLNWIAVDLKSESD